MTTPATFAAPDWNVIREDILCPLCDYNLRGLSEPRCPECGYQFHWPELLDPTRRNHPWLFEHHPRRNLRSFLRTSWGTLRPRRFFRTLYPTQHLVPRRLVLYWFLHGLLLTLACTAHVAVYIYYVRHVWINQLAGVGLFTLSDVAIRAIVSSLVHNGAFLALYLFLPWLYLLVLMIFGQTMCRLNIKRAHMLRCVLYCFDGGLWLTPVILLTTAFAFLDDQPMEAWWNLRSLWWFALAAWWVFGNARLYLALKRYIGMPHAAAVAAACGLIIFLVLFNLLLLPLWF